MKKYIALLALLAVAVPAFAQFRPVATYNKDILQGTPIVLAASGVTNIPVPAYIGKDGYAITAYFVGTNSGTATLGIGAVPAADGSKSTDAVALVGTVTMNGTTPVRSSVKVAGTANYGVGTLYFSVTNNHTASLIISNLTVSAW